MRLKPSPHGRGFFGGGVMAWGEMVRVGLRLGVSVEGFWRLSVREWRMLVEGSGVEGPLGRGELEELMRRWPDE